MIQLYRELGDRAGEEWALCSLGVLRHLEEDYIAATALYEGSLALCRELGDAFRVGGNLNNLANVARDLSDYEQATRLYRESLEVRRAPHDKPGFAECFEGLAIVAAALEQPERAARLFGAAEQLREATGHPVELVDRAPRERTVLLVCAALGEAGFAAVWAEGRALPLEEAVALALASHESAAIVAWESSPRSR